MYSVTPTARARLDVLTALRFVAALGVTLCHVVALMGLSGAWADALLFGQFGVDFFFVLSGFVLAWSWKPTRPMRRFYWLRFARIWPAHLTVVAVLLLLGARVAFWTQVQDLFLVQQWWPTQSYRWGVNGVTWTLSVEAFFYLVFPLIMPRLARLSTRRLVAIVAASWAVAGLVPVVTWRLTQYGTPWFTELNPYIRLPQFLVGSALALWVRRSAPRNRWLPGALKTVGVVGLGLLLAVFVCSEAGNWNLRRVPPWAFFLTVPWACLIAGFALSAREGARTCPRWLVTLGEWSFALYLVHANLVFHHLWPHLESWPRALAACVLIATSIAVSGVLYVVIERPAEQWLRARGPADRLVGTASPGA